MCERSARGDRCRVCGEEDWRPIGQRLELNFELIDDGPVSGELAPVESDVELEWICGICGYVRTSRESFGEK